jgi:glutathione peroxidase
MHIAIGKLLRASGKRFLTAILLIGPLITTGALAQTPAPGAASSCPFILKKTFNRLQDDAPQDLCQYAGKVLLVVNTASYCGFTSQYEGLEKLHADLNGKGLVVLGFPSNDFGQQEPGGSKEIADFCFNTYGVKFPMFAKSVVAGSNANVLYRALAEATGQSPQWNFHKYLIDRSGKVVGSYASNVEPQNKRLAGAIERALAN